MGTSAHPEPLLTLLTSQHPLVATAINGSLSAYTSSKSFSPRFRVGAEFVERNIASPVASTVGTAGRISGVESGVRWLLQRPDSSPGASPRGSKRRRTDDDDDEHNIDPRLTGSATPRAPRTRAISEISQADTLPAYDDERSPQYEEKPSATTTTSVQHQQQQRWQTRLVMTTSALGVAMSDESLRSLRFCLSWLRWANDHLGRALGSLQVVLREWEESQKQQHVSGASDDVPMPDAPVDGAVRSPRDPATIAGHLRALKAECITTLRNALDVVSTYAGGALPENARGLVRGHLISLPRRFQVATSATTTDGGGSGNSLDTEKQTPQHEAVTGARRVVVLTREGLDMIGQVGTVVDSVITEAERWCERLGRRVHGDGETRAPVQRSQGQEQQQHRKHHHHHYQGRETEGAAQQRNALGHKSLPQQHPAVDVKMEVDERS